MNCARCGKRLVLIKGKFYTQYTEQGFLFQDPYCNGVVGQSHVPEEKQ